MICQLCEIPRGAPQGFGLEWGGDGLVHSPEGLLTRTPLLDLLGCSQSSLRFLEVMNEDLDNDSGETYGVHHRSIHRSCS